MKMLLVSFCWLSTLHATTNAKWMVERRKKIFIAMNFLLRNEWKIACLTISFFSICVTKRKEKKEKKVEMSKNLIKIIRQSKFPDKLSCQLKWLGKWTNFLIFCFWILNLAVILPCCLREHTVKFWTYHKKDIHLLYTCKMPDASS